MLHATHIETETNEQNIQYYLDNYPEVEIVSCAKCKKQLCLWYLDPTQVQAHFGSHHRGMQRVTLSGRLLSSRKRLDGHMGYECACGNDSRLAELEDGIVPVQKFNKDGKLLNPDVSLEVYPHHEAAVKLLMARDGDKASVRKYKSKTTIDGFVHERLP